MDPNKRRTESEVISAYQNLFRADCAEAKIVLEDLAIECYEDLLTYVDGNPNGSAFNEGKRYVILRIRSMLKRKPENRPTQTINTDENERS